MSETSTELPSVTMEVVKPKLLEPKKEPQKPTLETQKIKKELFDPRTISKKHGTEERTEIASKILETRSEKRNLGVQVSENEIKAQNLDQNIVDLASSLSKRTDSLLVKAKSKLGISDEESEGLQKEIEALRTERIVLENSLQEYKERRRELPDQKKLLETYYQEVQTLPLSSQEKREYLKPEVLENLTTDEYIALWRRLNPYFLSHVTRQGFRDHNAMFYHSAGMREFHNGFVSVLEDDKLLRPPLAIYGLRTRDETAVREFLSDWVLQAEDEKEARQRLNDFLNYSLADAPKYPDKTAVHFANQTVADDLYGGEYGNEVFFIYPSDVLASQHNFAFNGWEEDFTQPQSEKMWNDVFVWPNTLDNPGISLDAGLVFLPESTPVNPNTGSRYASEIKVVDGEEKRVMVEDEGLVKSFIEWGKNLDEQSPVRQIGAAYKKERNEWSSESLRVTSLRVTSEELVKLGFTPDAAIPLSNELLGEMVWRDPFSSSEILEEVVKKSGANWKRAENTIPVKEYWENYFTKNPHLRPKHVVYYNGRPATAVYKFLQENGIGKADTSEAEGKLLGFDDHHVLLKGKSKDQDPRAMVGYDELVDTASRIISDHYKIKKGNT